MNLSKYANQRQREAVTPPHAPLRAIRISHGLTMDAVLDRMAEEGVTLSRGSLSAIESGQRGASIDTLDALALALGMAKGDLTVAYEPRERRESVPA